MRAVVAFIQEVQRPDPDYGGYGRLLCARNGAGCDADHIRKVCSYA